MTVDSIHNSCDVFKHHVLHHQWLVFFCPDYMVCKNNIRDVDLSSTTDFLAFYFQAIENFHNHYMSITSRLGRWSFLSCDAMAMFFTPHDAISIISGDILPSQSVRLFIQIVANDYFAMFF